MKSPLVPAGATAALHACMMSLFLPLALATGAGAETNPSAGLDACRETSLVPPVTFALRLHDGRLDLCARQASLRAVVGAVAARAGLTLRVYGTGDPTITGELHGLDLSAALRRILGSNYALLSVDTPAGDRLQGLVVVLPSDAVHLGTAPPASNSAVIAQLQSGADQLRAELQRLVQDPGAQTPAARPVVTIEDIPRIVRDRMEQLLIEMGQKPSGGD